MADRVCKACKYPTLRCGECGAECCDDWAVAIESKGQWVVRCIICLAGQDEDLEDFRPAEDAA